MRSKGMWRRTLAFAIATILAFGGMNIGVGPMVVQAESTNLVVNGDFEADWNATGWTQEGGMDSDFISNQASWENSTHYYKYWKDAAEEVSISQEVAVAEAGTYTAAMEIATGGSDVSALKFTVGGKSVEVPGTTDGWKTFTIEDIELEANSTVTVSIAGSVVANYWFNIDNITLTKDVTDDTTGDDTTDGDGDDVTDGDVSDGDGNDVTDGDVSGGDGSADDDGDVDTGSDVVSLWDATSLVANGNFETNADEATGWTITGGTSDCYVKYDEWTTNNKTHFYHVENKGDAPVAFSMTQTVSGLEAGTYKLVVELDGAKVASGLSVSVSGVTKEFPATAGWDVWTTVDTESFTLTETGDVTITISGDVAAGYWGNIDNIVLKKQNVVVTNGDFEANPDEATGWTVTGGTTDCYLKFDEWTENNTTHFYHVENKGDAPATFSMSQTVSNLVAGTYALKLELDGAESASGLSVSVNGVTKTFPATAGWDVWTTVVTDSFTLTEAGDVTITISGNIAAGYWGNIDNITICDPSVAVEDDNTGDVSDGDVSDGDADDDGIGGGTIIGDATPAKDVQINVDPVAGITEDFIGGLDISSYLVLKECGVKFYDYDGNELDNQGWFDFLADCGVNYVRIRVWNDPYDAEERGYGGGNNDLAKAIEMGQYATEAGIRVLIDFHYSDTWADPGRQLVPKAWEGLSTEETIAAIKEFTTNSLNDLLEAGVDVGMVQVGNETTTAFVGASAGSDEYYAYLKAGCEAVRAINEDILIALHFTNPENGKYDKTAKGLEEAGVDYDVFASSYYPMWHGTLENLQNELSNVREKYGKEVIVAETSWPYTSVDGDGGGSAAGTVGVDDVYYDISVHGQAGALRKVIETTVKAGGMGVFYWEPAWLPVNVIDWSQSNATELKEANENAWLEKGAGWASDYAGSYDSEVANWGGGGSQVDNQALFDFYGHPLQTLSIFKYAKEGCEGTVSLSRVMTASYKYVSGVDEFAMPGTVQVRYTDQNYKDYAVVWNQEQIDAALTAGTGTYTIDGTVTIDDATYNTACTLEVQLYNWLQNPGLEDSDTSMWEISNGSVASVGKENFRSGNYALRFWSGDVFSFEATQKVTLDAGYYTFGGYLMGDGTGEYKFFVQNGDEELNASAALNGWNEWGEGFEVEEFCVPNNGTTITVGVSVKDASAGAWGGFDDFYLYKTGMTPTPPVSVPDDSDDDSSSGDDSSSDDDSSAVEDTVIDWSEVQTEVQTSTATATTQTGSVNLNYTSTGETKVPTAVLNEIKGENVTVAFQSGNGVALSISGQKLNGVDVSKLQNVDLTVTHEPNVIPDLVVASKAAVAKKELSIRDTGSFGVAVDMHINVGKENAGKIANLYRYNPTSGKLEFCSHFVITAEGQSMFAIGRGGDYLITVTNTTVNETAWYFGGDYTVQAGDSLSKIAVRYHMPLAELIRRNPQLTNLNMIKPGQKLNVN